MCAHMCNRCRRTTTHTANFLVHKAISKSWPSCSIREYYIWLPSQHRLMLASKRAFFVENQTIQLHSIHFLFKGRLRSGSDASLRRSASIAQRPSDYCRKGQSTQHLSFGVWKTFARRQSGDRQSRDEGSMRRLAFGRSEFE